MVLIMILAFLFTAGLIVNNRVYQFHQNKLATQIVKEEEEEVEKKPLTDVTLYEEYHLPINDDAKGATSSQRFDINPIKFTEHIYEDEKTYAYYLQIDGMIDDEIERKINERLKNEIIDYGHYAYEMILKKEDGYIYFDKYQKDKYVDQNASQWNSCVKEAILFNGCNVLSISLTNPYDAITKKNKFLNYNLVTGEEIKIEEIFTKDYSVIENFKNILYYSLGEGDISWNEKKYYNEATGEYEFWRRRWYI